MTRPVLRARNLLDRIPHPGPSHWNSLIGACSSHCNAGGAVAAYMDMLASGARPDEYTFPFLLKSFALDAAAAYGIVVHAHVLKFGLLSNAHVSTALIHIYAVGGDSAAARQLLDASPMKDMAVMWNSLMSGHNRSKQFPVSCSVFVDMARAGVRPTPVTYMSVLSACAKGKDMVLGMQVHKCIEVSGMLPDLKMQNALIDMYAECSDMDAAWRLFDSMQMVDVVSWTSVAGGFARLGQVDQARALFDCMLERDTVSWTAMITGYARAGRFKEALEMFHGMQFSRVRADEFTMVSVFTACAQLGALETGEWARVYMSRNRIKMDVFVSNALIDMYSKCGSIERAMDIFKQMHRRDKFTWTAIIVGLAVNGRGEEAINMFHKMIRDLETPDAVTFVGVLTACTHVGMVDEGKGFFLSMIKNYGIMPNLTHYGCMIDLLGRAGRLKEALGTIADMPISPNSTIWGTLLGACRVHGNAEIGELAARRLFELEPENSMAYILLSNIYAKCNRWADVRRLRQSIMEKGIKKEPGCSLIEINGVMHEFVAGDRSHPLSKVIYSKLEEIIKDLKGAGYVPDTTEVFVEVAEGEKEKVLSWHSEKLAIAFALISSELDATIRIVKNLRICLDCHNAMKLVSKLYRRDIVARDRTRYHHFSRGSCSCKDYW